MFYSPELINHMHNKHSTFAVSIHRKPDYTLDPQFLQQYPDEYKEEISKFMSLKELINEDMFKKLENEIVLMEYPNSSSWSTTYYLQFMKLVSVETKDNKTYLRLDNVPPRKLTVMCLEPMEYFISLDDLKSGMRNLYNIFIPSEMYKVRIENNNSSYSMISVSSEL